ncbi:hypothetical protein AXF42_Ash002292 [Apostasia shenzhenica]|uniref:J domain-containing protein n=1 Tax=Apostasia shenzhenica TaxID=1088818 RepID=A0A2I0AN36_9ASPA|nr:hypothetical protein AXF42_Ash002292 [Apostasia shenzhenica]
MAWWRAMCRRRLSAATVSILRRDLRSCPHLPHGIGFSPPPSRVFSGFVPLSGGHRFAGGLRRIRHLCPFFHSRPWDGSPYSTVSGNGEASACWNCGKPAPPRGPFLSCEACRAVQPVDSSLDYFQIFGLEQRYDMRDENLEGKYKEWQKKLHPDLVHSKSEKEKSHAAEQSARVIDAYRTLSQPLSRALYLLQLAGIHVDEEKIVMDPELLAEMMEIREAVEETNGHKELMKIQCQIQKKLEDWSNIFQEAFNKREFDSAIVATQRMRYYERAVEEIVKKL